MKKNSVLQEQEFSKDYFDDIGEDSFSTDWKPQDMSFDTFKLRNDPSNLLKTIKYLLMQVEEQPDPNNNNKIVLVPKSNNITKEKVKPLMTQQGVEEVMLSLQPIINNHNVMGNLTSNEDLKRFMYDFSNDLTIFFWNMQEKWELRNDYVNPLIQFISHQVYIFLSRTIGDLERTHYGESFKETREVKPPTQEKKNFLSGFVPQIFKR